VRGRETNQPKEQECEWVKWLHKMRQREIE
jgi:hypothetical protein